MPAEDIEIRTDSNLGRPYKELGPIKTRVTTKFAFGKPRTVEEVNSKLRREALKMGANAVINVTYDRGISLTSWQALTAYGTAVTVDTEGQTGVTGVM